MLVHATGEGVVNALINNLPFEGHLPGYNWCGPGTRVEERLRRGDPGINPLDAACKAHDIAYTRDRDLQSRHRADRALADRAWQRVKSKDASFGEKAAAWTVTNIMKAKTKLGMGVGTASRRRRAKKPKAKKTAFGAVLRETRRVLKDAKPLDLRDAAKVALVAARRAVKKAGGKKRITTPRVIPIPKTGGILPLLPALFGGLTALGSLAGGAAGIAKSVKAAKNAQDKLEEMRRHNQKMEAIALGKGLYLSTRKKSGFGLYLGKKPSKN